MKSLLRYEQVPLMRAHFQRYFYHHRENYKIMNTKQTSQNIFWYII